MSTHRALIGKQAIRLIVDFLRQLVLPDDRDSRREFLLTDLDVAFQQFHIGMKEEFAGGCEACDERDSCLSPDALQILCPDPVTGISSAFHDYLRIVADIPIAVPVRVTLRPIAFKYPD